MWLILIPVTEPESLASYSGEIPDQARDEGNMCRQCNPATPLGFTILPNTTGVHTPAYVLSPLQG